MTRYSARRLPRHLGPAAWDVILGNRATAPKLTKRIIADFVIIGGGFAGLSAARRLCQLQPTAKIVMLEAGRIAEGAAGRNSGFMIDLPHDISSDNYAGSDDDKTLIALNRKAIGFARNAVAEYNIDSNFFDEAGKVNGAVSETGIEHNNSYAEHLASVGEPLQLLDAQDMHDLTGSRHYQAGLFTPGTVILQPAGYIRGLADGLSNKAEIYENSAVTGFVKIGNDWRVELHGAAVTAPKVILANNGHLESFGFKRGRLMQLFLYASMTAELDADAMKKLGGKSRWGITPSDPMGTTVRRIDTPLGGNRVVTRTCATLRPGMVASKRDLIRAAAVHQRKFDERFPALAGAKMEHVWAGHLCLSRNSVSVMRELDDGVYSACVQNGLGTARGTLTGIGAAELACQETSDITRYFTAQDEPTALPPKPFSTLGANTYLRWKEWRAGGE